MEASFTILESINHMKGVTSFLHAFLMFAEVFDTVWVDRLLYKLFSELGIKERMWLGIKERMWLGIKYRCESSGSL